MPKPARASARAARVPGSGRQPEAGASALRSLRRAQIVAAARAIVAARGLEALTFGSLEQQLGFSRGVLTYHFADKDEIVAALLRSAVAEIDAATSEKLSGAGSLEDTVRAVLRTKVHGFLGHPEAVEILIAFWSRSPGGPAAAWTARLFAGYRAQSASLVRLAKKLDPRCAADPAAMAALLVGVVIGLVVQARFEPGAVQIEAALEEAARTLLLRLVPQAERGGR